MIEFAATTFVTLFVILDPVGNIPIFLSITPDSTAADRTRIARRASVVAATVLLIMGIGGEQLLKALGITLPAFRIAGGVLLLLLAVEMVFARHSGLRTTTSSEEKEAVARHDVAVFPLAIPLVAGPGAITYMFMMMGGAEAKLLEKAVVIAVLAVVLTLNFAVLAFGSRILARVGLTGINVLTRIFGIVLTALAVQFIIDGAEAVLK